MFLEKIHSEGIAHLSYIIGDEAAAAVIDPRRDCDIYIDIARQNGARITHIFETHRNEDYAIGSGRLSHLTGAAIYHGPHMNFTYGQPVSAGDTFQLGDVLLQVHETPGHTYESISISVRDRAFGEKPVAVFTGDALFISDVGRTDFFPDRKKEVAGLLYDSIMNTLLPLGDQAIVCPAHGAGSVCGAGMASREFSTIGYERLYNPMLQLEKNEFIEKKVAEHHYIPPYFRRMEQYNQHGAPVFERLPQPEPHGPDEFAREIDMGMQVLDVRSPEAIAGAYITGSITIPLGMVPAFAGWFLSYDRPIGIVAEQRDHVETAVRHLVRLGYDSVIGYLEQGMHAWETSGRMFERIGAVTIVDVKRRIDTGEKMTLVDVRGRDEFYSGHLPGALHIYAGEIADNLDSVPRDKPVVTYCGSGRRAIIAASVLKNNGFDKVEDCLGSMAAYKASGFLDVA